MEPYVYSQMIAGKDARRQGEAKNSWLTGAAAWNFVAWCPSGYSGVKPDYDGLIIDPCIPAQWDGVPHKKTIQRLELLYCNKEPGPCLEGGVARLVIDGTELIGNQLPIFNDTATHIV